MSCFLSVNFIRFIPQHTLWSKSPFHFVKKKKKKNCNRNHPLVCHLLWFAPLPLFPPDVCSTPPPLTHPHLSPGSVTVQPGKGLTSCTTTCSLTPASPWLAPLASRPALTSQKTRTMTVFGPPLVTGLPRSLVRYKRPLQVDALAKLASLQLGINVTSSQFFFFTLVVFVSSCICPLRLQKLRLAATP